MASLTCLYPLQGQPLYGQTIQVQYSTEHVSHVDGVVLRRMLTVELMGLRKRELPPNSLLHSSIKTKQRYTTCIFSMIQIVISTPTPSRSSVYGLVYPPSSRPYHSAIPYTIHVCHVDGVVSCKIGRMYSGNRWFLRNQYAIIVQYKRFLLTYK